jgi:hypothetical protein
MPQNTSGPAPSRQVLNYSRPGAPTAAAVTPELIRRRLLEHGSGNIGIDALQIAAGFGITLIAPFMLATIAVYFGGWKVMGWGAWFSVLWVVLTMFLMWQEWRHRGHGASSLLDSLDSGPASSYGEFEMRRLTGVAAFFTELFLLGPRLILDAVERLSGRAVPPHLDRAAEVVYDLWRTDGGVAPQSLLRPGETFSTLAPIIVWLKRHEWIDVSSRRDRVWLLTTARKRI